MHQLALFSMQVIFHFSLDSLLALSLFADLESLIDFIVGIFLGDESDLFCSLVSSAVFLVRSCHPDYIWLTSFFSGKGLVVGRRVSCLEFQYPLIVFTT